MSGVFRWWSGLTFSSHWSWMICPQPWQVLSTRPPSSLMRMLSVLSWSWILWKWGPGGGGWGWDRNSAFGSSTSSLTLVTLAVISTVMVTVFTVRNVLDVTFQYCTDLMLDPSKLTEGWRLKGWSGRSAQPSPAPLLRVKPELPPPAANETRPESESANSVTSTFGGQSLASSHHGSHSAQQPICLIVNCHLYI